MLVARPGLITSMAMERLHETAAVAAGIGVKRLERKSHRPNGQVEDPGLDGLDVAVVLFARDRLPLDDVAGAEEHHEVPEIGQPLRRVVDRRRRDPEQLITTGAAHRVDGSKAAAMADSELRRVGTRPQIFWYLDLLFA